MSTPWILRRLYSLDSSSTDFLRHLHSLIRHDEEEQYLTNLQGLELARLVDFLDEVRTSFFCFLSSYEMGSADSRRYTRRRRRFSPMSTETTNHLRSLYDPATLVYRGR